jgi:hypothetical protein
MRSEEGKAEPFSKINGKPSVTSHYYRILRVQLLNRGMKEKTQLRAKRKSNLIFLSSL